jgi:hypothetical protein
MEHNWVKFQSKYGTDYKLNNEEKCTNCGLEVFTSIESGKRIIYFWNYSDIAYIPNEMISCAEFIIKKHIGMTHNFIENIKHDDREVICSICGLLAFKSYKNDGSFIFHTYDNGYQTPDHVRDVTCDEFIIKKIIE